jgi:hypothetical protein
MLPYQAMIVCTRARESFAIGRPDGTSRAGRVRSFKWKNSKRFWVPALEEKSADEELTPAYGIVAQSPLNRPPRNSRRKVGHGLRGSPSEISVVSGQGIGPPAFSLAASIRTMECGTCDAQRRLPRCGDRHGEQFMAMPVAAAARNVHSRRIVFDTIEWHSRLKRLVEMVQELPTPVQQNPEIEVTAMTPADKARQA